MLKLIIKLPEEADANMLLVTALSLAEYKRKHYYQFKMKYDSSVMDYCNVNLPQFEPTPVYDSVTSMEDFRAGIKEYELDGSVLDPYLMERLAELQKLIPFEMYFEQRGAYDAAKWMYENPGWLGDIEDAALHSLFWQGATA